MVSEKPTGMSPCKKAAVDIILVYRKHQWVCQQPILLKMIII